MKCRNTGEPRCWLRPYGSCSCGRKRHRGGPLFRNRNMCVSFVCCDFKPSLPTSLMCGSAREFRQILMRYSTCGLARPPFDVASLVHMAGYAEHVGSRCRCLLFSAWIILNTGGFGTSAHLSTRPFRCCVDKRMVSVRPQTPDFTKAPLRGELPLLHPIREEIDEHYLGP